MDISFLFSFAFHFSEPFVRPTQTVILPFCISFSWEWFWSPPPVQCYEPPSIVLQALCLSGLILWIFCLCHCIVTGIWFGSYLNGLVISLLQFKSKFCNTEFIILTTFSSQSYFCWLYRASPSLAAKNTVNLILVLTIWWCSCVESSLMLLEEGVCYDQSIVLSKLC